MSYAFWADVISLFHGALVGFVVVGQLLIVVGVARRWGWVRNFWFRLAHLLLIGYVGLEAIFHIACPLTVWEWELRELAGQPVTGEGFVARCINALLINNTFDEWVYDYLHIGFALLVLATFVLAPPRRPQATLRPMSKKLSSFLISDLLLRLLRKSGLVKRQAQPRESNL